MKHLTQAECIEICKLINPNLKWEWNDHFNIEDQPYYAVNGLGSSTELFMIKIYYNHDKITIIDGNNEIMEEKIVKFQSNKKILQILDNNHSKVNEITSNSKDDSSKFVLKKYVDKITDKFSTIIEYRMKKSSILNNNDGLPYTYKFDLNVRIFVENNDFLNSKIVLVLTFYAPEPGT